MKPRRHVERQTRRDTVANTVHHLNRGIHGIHAVLVIRYSAIWKTPAAGSPASAAVPEPHSDPPHRRTEHNLSTLCSPPNIGEIRGPTQSKGSGQHTRLSAVHRPLQSTVDNTVHTACTRVRPDIQSQRQQAVPRVNRRWAVRIRIERGRDPGFRAARENFLVSKSLTLFTPRKSVLVHDGFPSFFTPLTDSI